MRTIEALKARGGTAVRRSAILLALGLFVGCATLWNEQSHQIADGNHAVSHGDYVTAHQYYEAAAEKAEDLSPRQLRQVRDGLCLSEYHIGPPSYTVAQQLRTCADALSQDDSKSGPIYVELAQRERARASDIINTALTQRDIAAFDQAVTYYRSLPGSNLEAVNHWTRQAWSIADVDDRAALGKAALTRTIAKLSHNFPKLHNMSNREFRYWVGKSMTVQGTSIVSSVEIGKHTVVLRLAEEQIQPAALNLDRFARVNDGLVVRCRCNAHTDVAVAESDLPLYLVRLDAASRESEVLILH